MEGKLSYLVNGDSVDVMKLKGMFWEESWGCVLWTLSTIGCLVPVQTLPHYQGPPDPLADADKTISWDHWL